MSRADLMYAALSERPGAVVIPLKDRRGGLYFDALFADEDEAARAVSAWRAEHMPFANEERTA